MYNSIIIIVIVTDTYRRRYLSVTMNDVLSPVELLSFFVHPVSFTIYIPSVNSRR